MKKLEVRFEGWGQDWPLGALADDGRQILFEYSAEALQRGLELSPRHLPLRAGAFSDFPRHLDHLPGLISDALPDGWGRLLMDRLWRQAGRRPEAASPLERLAFIGRRAMGALTFRPAEDWGHDLAAWGLRELAQAARQQAEQDIEALRALALAGGSPHGARPKALVCYDPIAQTLRHDDGAAVDPDSGEPWLVKFPARGEHPEVCAIEHAYAALARACGVRMGATAHFPLGPKLAAFGTQRFDRARGLRVPVHSLAGALQTDFRLPALDYETVLRATAYFTQDQTQVLAAYRLCVFNVVFHNRDDHAKNFALRLNERLQWELAPGFDLTFDPGPNGQHQTSVMGEAQAPGRTHLLALAHRLALPMAQAPEVIDQTCTAAAALPGALEEAGVRRATQRVLTKAVQANRQRCGAAAPGRRT